MKLLSTIDNRRKITVHLYAIEYKTEEEKFIGKSCLGLGSVFDAVIFIVRRVNLTLRVGESSH